MRTSNKSILPLAMLGAVEDLASVMGGNGTLRDAAGSYFPTLNTKRLERAAVRVNDGLKALPVNVLVDAGNELRSELRMWGNRDAHMQLLRHTQSLAPLFLWHGDGRVREAALKAITSPIDSAFHFAAIAYRLNDWVPQVRAAAEATARRVFPATAPELIAAEYLFEQIDHLKRWGASESEILRSTLCRPDMLSVLAITLLNSTSGRAARTLRRALRLPGLDDRLPQLATNSKMANVRALATESLLLGAARWWAGHKFEWVDKSHGISQRVPVIELRPLTITADPDALIERGARDKASIVRRAVMQGLISHRFALTPVMVQAARSLANDRTYAVRFRAEFVLKEAKLTT